MGKGYGEVSVTILNHRFSARHGTGMTTANHCSNFKKTRCLVEQQYLGALESSKYVRISRDGHIVFRLCCPLGNHSPQFGCPGLIPDSIIVSLHVQTRKMQLPTGQPRFLLWLPNSISWLSRALGYHKKVDVRIFNALPNP